MSSIVLRAQRNPAIWFLALFAAILLIQGPGFVDHIDFSQIAPNPWKLEPPVDRQFLYSSPLNFILGWLLHLDQRAGYFLIHGVEVILMVVMVIRAIKQKIADHDRQIWFISLLALTPLWFIVIKWFGKTDPLLIGFLFLAWAKTGRFRIVYGTVMILAHREVGSLMCLALYLLEDRKDNSLLYGLLVGNALQLIYQYGLLDHPPATRIELMAIRAPLFLRPLAIMPGLYIASMFSWYWIVLILNKINRKETLVIFVAFVLAALNEDFTRDFTLAALPATIFHIERVIQKRENEKLTRLYPLTPFHYQIAILGQMYGAANPILYFIGIGIHRIFG